MIHYSFLRGLMAVAAMSSACALDAPFAYVPNEGSGTVSLIGTENDQVVAEIPAGKKPRGLAAGADKHWLYVSDQPNNSLELIDLRERKLMGHIDLGMSPEGVDLSPA